jgi:hypothetical protein
MGTALFTRDTSFAKMLAIILSWWQGIAGTLNTNAVPGVGDPIKCIANKNLFV